MNVSFAFDDQSYQILQEMKTAAGFDSDAATVRQALRIMRALQQQAARGYSEVVMQDPTSFGQVKLKIDLLGSQHEAQESPMARV